MCFINIKIYIYIFLIFIIFHTMFATHFGSWLFHYKSIIKVYTANGTEVQKIYVQALTLVCTLSLKATQITSGKLTNHSHLVPAAVRQCGFFSHTWLTFPHWFVRFKQFIHSPWSYFECCKNVLQWYWIHNKSGIQLLQLAQMSLSP